MCEAQSETHTHTHAHAHTQVRHGVSHMCERANTADHTQSLLSGGSFTCCNRVYMSRLQKTRAGEACGFHTPWMSCSASVHVFTRACMFDGPRDGIRGLSSASVTRCHGQREGCFQQIGLFTWLFISPCSCLSSSNAAKPKSQRRSGHAPACRPSVVSLSLHPAVLKDVISCTIPVWKAPATHARFRLFLRSSEVVQLGWMCMQM